MKVGDLFDLKNEAMSMSLPVKTQPLVQHTKR